MTAGAQVQLANPPTDGVSSLAWSPTDGDVLAAGSWDGSVRIYDTAANTLRERLPAGAAVLDLAWMGRDRLVTANLDCTVKVFSVGDQNGAPDPITLGQHTAAVRCIRYCDKTKLVYSGSWDKTIKVWDPSSTSVDKCVGTCSAPDKVFTMDLVGTTLVVGTAGRHVYIYDVNNMEQAKQVRESSLKYQTRCIRILPDESAYTLSSIEGRVAFEYIDPSPAAQEKKYAFKCHRSTTNGVDTVYPVNAMAFHPTYHTFASGGCDGFVNVWDGRNKKRLHQYNKYPTSVAALAFNCVGTKLAVASSYTFEEGDKQHPDDNIFIRTVDPAEVMPKQRAK